MQGIISPSPPSCRAIPDKWINLLKHTRDEKWSMREIVAALCNRWRGRGGERVLGQATDE